MSQLELTSEQMTTPHTSLLERDCWQVESFDSVSFQGAYEGGGHARLAPVDTLGEDTSQEYLRTMLGGVGIDCPDYQMYQLASSGVADAKTAGKHFECDGVATEVFNFYSERLLSHCRERVLERQARLTAHIAHWPDRFAVLLRKQEDRHSSLRLALVNSVVSSVTDTEITPPTLLVRDKKGQIGMLPSGSHRLPGLYITNR